MAIKQARNPAGTPLANLKFGKRTEIIFFSLFTGFNKTSEAAVRL
jgi:hypothetical protein